MKKLWAYLYLVAIAWYLYVVVIFPVDQATIARRHLGLGQARAISLTIAVLMVLIWLVALYSAHKLFEYGKSIKKSPDGPPFIKLATGLIILAVYLPVRMINKITLGNIAHDHPAFVEASNIIITYVNLIFLLVAFIFIGLAAHRLGRIAKVKISLRAAYALGLLFIAVGVCYCYAAFSVTDSFSPTNWLITSQQAIPMGLRVVTVVIPNLFMWFVGLLAVYEMNLYRKQVPGFFYRTSLKQLSQGLTIVIFAAIGLQFFTVTAPKLQRLSFGVVLVLAYGLILLLGIAFFIIARGVQKLKKLDEV